MRPSSLLPAFSFVVVTETNHWMVGFRKKQMLTVDKRRVLIASVKRTRGRQVKRREATSKVDW
jgi:hypothetical protein